MSAVAFMLVSCIGTWICRGLDIKFYGAGFWAGSVVFSITAFVGLRLYLKRLLYHVLSAQPLLVEEKRGVFTDMAAHFGNKYEKKWKKELHRERRMAMEREEQL